MKADSVSPSARTDSASRRSPGVTRRGGNVLVFMFTSSCIANAMHCIRRGRRGPTVGPALAGLYPRRADHLPPLLDLGLHEASEFLRRAAYWIGAFPRQPVAGVRLLEDGG